METIQQQVKSIIDTMYKYLPYMAVAYLAFIIISVAIIDFTDVFEVQLLLVFNIIMLVAYHIPLIYVVVLAFKSGFSKKAKTYYKEQIKPNAESQEKSIVISSFEFSFKLTAFLVFAFFVFWLVALLYEWLVQ